MTTYDTSLPVHVRIGDRREWIVGDVPADHNGRVDPVTLGAMLIATGEYMHHLVALERRTVAEKKEDAP